MPVPALALWALEWAREGTCEEATFCGVAGLLRERVDSSWDRVWVVLEEEEDVGDDEWERVEGFCGRRDSGAMGSPRPVEGSGVAVTDDWSIELVTARTTLMHHSIPMCNFE